MEKKYAHIVKLDMMPIALLFNKDRAIIKFYAETAACHEILEEKKQKAEL